MKKASTSIAKDNKALKTVLTKGDGKTVFTTLLNPKISDAKKKELFKTTYHVDAVHYETGETLLIAACQLGNYSLAKLLIEAGADPNKTAPSGKYPLYCGVQVGREMTQLLVEAGAKIDYASDKAPYDFTPLAVSVKSDKYPSFIYLILKGANSNLFPIGGESPLYAAAQQKDIKFLTLLLRQKGIIIDNPDNQGDTPLLTAVDHHNPDAVKLLLQAGANVNHQNKVGRTVFHIVSINGDEAILKILLEYKSHYPQTNIEIQDSEGNTPLQVAVCNRLVLHTQLFLEAGASSNTQNKLRQSPLCLMVATTKGIAFDQSERSIFNLLLQHQVDVNQLNHDGETTCTALSLAVQSGKKGVAILLLDSGANPAQEIQVSIITKQVLKGDDPATIKKEKIEKTTPFHLAALCSDEIVESMINRKVEIDVLDELYRSPLFNACVSGSARNISLLLGAGANPNTPDVLGDTPFHIVCGQGIVDQINIFFNSRGIKPNINTTNLQGFTPLHSAAIEGRVDVVKLLCQRDAMVNVAANDGASPLFLAAQEGFHEVVKFLLSVGADAELKRKDGMCALGVAHKYKHQQVVRVIIEEFYCKNREVNSKVHIESLSELLYRDNFRIYGAYSFYIDTPVPAPTPNIPERWESSDSKMQSAYSFLKERGFSSEEIEEMKVKNKAKRTSALPVSSSKNKSTANDVVTESKKSDLLIPKEIAETQSEPVLSTDPMPEKGQKEENANNAPSPVLPATAVSTISPTVEKPALAPGKVEVIHHGRIDVDLASLRKPSPHTPAPSPVERRPALVPAKPKLKSDSVKDPVLIDQIIQEAIALSHELKPEMTHIHPLFTTNDIDRLSLRFDTFQMFHKIYLLADNAYQDIVKVNPDNPLASTLKSFCDTVRKFRNMMIHRPNYVDYTVEEEVKQFILNSGFILWCTELREHANKLVATGGKPATDADSTELNQIFLTLSNRVLSLKSYQQLKDSQDNQSLYDECYEQLLFAVKLLAFNEEKSEIQEPTYYKLRRQKASSILATIIDEYGFYAQTHLSPGDFDKIKSTPLYQVAIEAKMKYGTSRVSFLDACHQFRNNKVSHLVEKSMKSEKFLPSMNTTPEIGTLQKHAKKVCEKLGIKHINDTIKAVTPSPSGTPVHEASSTSSHEKILSSLKSDAPVLGSDIPKLNPNAPEFKPLLKPAAINPTPLIQKPVHGETIVEVVTVLPSNNGEALVLNKYT